MSTFDETVKALCILYGLEEDKVKPELMALGDKFNFKKKDSVDIDEEHHAWKQITEALRFRAANAVKAQDSILALKSLGDISVTLTNKLTNKMETLKDRCTAHFSANEISGACYHAYFHGVEMSGDPGKLLLTLLPSQNKDAPFIQLIQALVNALGAAHDIIQGKGAPMNEEYSANIFVTEAKRIIADFKREILSSSYPTLATNKREEIIEILNNFETEGLPFLAKECIVNSTYFLINSGKRDFDNILWQIQKELMPKHKSMLNPIIAAMKMAMSISDTRRSEIKEVLERLEVLKNIPKEQLPDLEALLKGIGLLTDGQSLEICEPASDQLMKIEGFLLRIGQNLRMCAECAAVFASPGTEAKEKGLKLVNTIRELRIGKEVTFSKEDLDRLIKSMEGEISFATGLGKIDKEELREQANYYDLRLDETNLDITGWERHAEELGKFNAYLSTLDPEKIVSTTRMLYTLAAKPPGHRVTKEIYNALRNLERELPPGIQQVTIKKVLAEMEATNPHLLTIRAPEISTSDAATTVIDPTPHQLGSRSE